MKKLFTISGLFFCLASHAQNVGIGETSPANKLSVKGSLSVGASYSTTAAPTNGAIIQGNVGIGQATASYSLDVNGVINAATGFKVAGGTPTTGTYLKGNGTNFVAGTIQAADVPTLNQNTTGSAASFTGNLSGDVTGTQSATTVVKINGTSLAGLSTGILKNTTGTGVPSIAVAADFPTLNQNTTGSAASFTGSLSGDVTGTQSATSLSKIQGIGLSISSLTSGNILQYNGTNWVNVTPASTAVNIYNTDGTLTGNRTVTMGANSLTLSTTGGNMILGSGDGSAAPAGGIFRGPNAGSGNTGGGTLQLKGGFGWGSGPGGSVYLQAGSAGGSGGTNGNAYLRGGYGNNAEGAVYINDGGNGTSAVTAYFGNTYINNNGSGSSGGSIYIGGGTGLLKVTGGLVSTATAAVDYQAPITAGTGLYYSATNTLASYWTLSGSNLYSNNSGNVGIGTGATAPNNTLSINGSSATWNQGKYLIYSDAGATQRGYWGPGRNNDLTLLQSTSNWLRISNASQISFWANGNGATDDNPQAFLTNAGVFNTTGLVVGVANSGGTTTAGTAISNLQAGSTTIPTLSCSSGCVQTVTVTLNFPSGVTPKMICTVANQSGTSYSDTYATQIKSISNTSATINICRTDSYYNGQGWGQNATLNWMAWY